MWYINLLLFSVFFPPPRETREAGFDTFRGRRASSSSGFDILETSLSGGSARPLSGFYCRARNIGEATHADERLEAFQYGCSGFAMPAVCVQLCVPSSYMLAVLRCCSRCADMLVIVFRYARRGKEAGTWGFWVKIECASCFFFFPLLDRVLLVVRATSCDQEQCLHAHKHTRLGSARHGPSRSIAFAARARVTTGNNAYVADSGIVPCWPKV